MTGSKELAKSVLSARNTRWFCGAVVAPVAAGIFAVTSAEAAGTVIHNFMQNQPITWDIARIPALSFGFLMGSQVPAFFANNHMVSLAKGEHSSLSEAVMNARRWRNRKRALETVGVVMLPTFLPDGLKGGVFSGIPLAGALASRLAEATYNAEAHHQANTILRSGKIEPRRMVSVA